MLGCSAPAEISFSKDTKLVRVQPNLGKTFVKFTEEKFVNGLTWQSCGFFLSKERTTGSICFYIASAERNWGINVTITPFTSPNRLPLVNDHLSAAVHRYRATCSMIFSHLSYMTFEFFS